MCFEIYFAQRKPCKIGAKESDIVFELRDDEFLNDGTIGIKSITLILVRFRGTRKVES